MMLMMVCFKVPFPGFAGSPVGAGETRYVVKLTSGADVHFYAYARPRDGVTRLRFRFPGKESFSYAELTPQYRWLFRL